MAMFWFDCYHANIEEKEATPLGPGQSSSSFGHQFIIKFILLSKVINLQIGIL